MPFINETSTHITQKKAIHTSIMWCNIEIELQNDTLHFILCRFLTSFWSKF